MSRIWGVFLVLAAIAGSAQPAAAQPPERPRLTVGVGAGTSDPLHGDFNYLAPSWDAALRGRPSEHITVEVFLSEWRHSESSESRNIPLQNATGVIGTIGLLSQRSVRQQWSMGVNVLPTFSRGRVTVMGGGGGGVMLLAHRFKQALSDCVSSAPVSCSDYSTTHGAGSLTVQLAGGVDVTLTHRLAAFAQSRFVVPIEDPGAGHTAFTAGVRLTLR
jgi:hypothetical protein